MAGQQRVYRQKIKATSSLKKIFRAMELIAASRIGKARLRVDKATPYTRAITRMISAVAAHSTVEHPLTTARTDTGRAAVLVVSADRGMAGAYSANVIRESERLRGRLMADGKEVVQFASGRRAVSYFSFRRRELAGQWTGGSDAPGRDTAREMAKALFDRFQASKEDGGVDEIYLVGTRFISMVTQQAMVLRLLPLELVEGVEEAGAGEVQPLYDFEPSPEQVLDALLRPYIESRLYGTLLHCAASELANRQRAMNTATSNAEDIIRNYTRLANQARQAEITQEISEIVSGADALAAS